MANNDMVYLAACAVNEAVPDAARVAGMDMDALYQQARRHMLCATIAVALKAAGVREERFEKALNRSVLKNARMDAEMEMAFAEMDAEGIWHMPLKGTVLQHLYPVYGMRQMSDHDILFDADRAGDVRAIMERFGFRVQSFDKSIHDIYLKAPVSNFEMHRTLFTSRPFHNLYEYYQDVSKRLIGEGFEKRFTPEDFYIYMVAHEYKHYAKKGTGLRSLLDTYVWLKKKPLNWDYVTTETEKLGISDFEVANRALSLHLFDQEPLTDAEQHMMDYIMSSGTYGTEAQAIELDIARRGNRWNYFLSRMTIPYDTMLRLYPILRKMPVFYPVCWLHRLIKAFFCRKGRFMLQLKAVLGFKIK